MVCVYARRCSIVVDLCSVFLRVNRVHFVEFKLQPSSCIVCLFGKGARARSDVAEASGMAQKKKF